MSSDPRHHRADYLEFTATDIAATKAFYATVFGWRFTDYGPDYTSFEDGRMTGGFMKGPAAPRGGLLCVIYSQALEATQAAVLAHGGSICRPIFGFPGGRRFHFLDPNGNELAVWTEQGDQG